MPREGDQKWFFCGVCWKDRIFEWVHKSHGLMGGHWEWHCTSCGDCDKREPAKNH